MVMSRTYFGFKQKGVQLPLFMIWTEYWEDGDVVFARALYNSMDLEASIKRFWCMTVGAFGFMAGA